MNYLVIDTNSNLVVGLISSSTHPANSSRLRFYLANDRAVTVYLNHLSKYDHLPDIGDIQSRCKHLNSVMIDQRASKITGPLAKPQTIRCRPEQPPTVQGDRETLIASWILANPSADAHALSDVFLCGIFVARAYLSKYS